MSTERYGLAGMGVEQRQFYDMLLLSRAVPNFVHMNWGKKTPIPARMGNSIDWRRLELITTSTTALTSGTPPTSTNVTFTHVSATVLQYGQYVLHSEILASQAIDPVISEIVEALGESMSDCLDQIVRNVMTAGTTVQYASTASCRAQIGSGMRLTLAEIREAVGTLRRAKAKPLVDGLYILITHTDSIEDLQGDSDIQSMMENAGVRGDSNPLFKGTVGDVAGVRIITTTNGRTFASEGLSGADVYGTMIIGQEFYGISEFGAMAARTYIKAVGSSGAKDPLDQYGSVGWKASVAAARLNENFGLRIEHSTSQSNSS